MRTFTKLLLGSVGALTLAAAAAPSQAAVVEIWYKDGTGLHQLGAPSSTINSYSGTVGNFQVSLSGASSTSPLFGTTDLQLTTLGSGVAGDLDLFVSVTGLTAPLSSRELFHTVLTVGAIPAGWTIEEQAWLDAGNQAGAGLSLGSLLFNGTGQNGQTGTTDTQMDTGPGPYSISTEYKVHATTAASTNLTNTIQVFAQGGVPEPTTWALMLIGFGGAGAMLRRRRAVAAAA